MKRLTIIFLILLITQPTMGEDMLAQKWEFETREEPNHVFIINTNENPALEIIVDARRSGRIFAVDHNGNQVWKYGTAGILFDLDVKQFDKPGGEILAGSFTRAYSVNADGASNWKYFTQHREVQSVFVDDLDGDGKAEAVIGTTGNTGNSAIVIDESGSKMGLLGLNRFTFPYSYASIDVNGDGILEVAVGCAGYSMNTQAQSYDFGFTRPNTLKLINYSASEIWSFPTAGGVSSLIAGDVNADGSMDLIAGSNQRVYVVDKRGKQVWDYITHGIVYDLAHADVDGDGRNEVIVASDKIYVLKDDGGLFWESRKYQGVYALEAADIDLDGKTEIIAGTTKLMVYDETGKLEWSSSDIGRVSDLAVADLDRDGYYEVAVSTRNGRLRLFETEPYAKKKRGDNLFAEARKAYNSRNYSLSEQLAVEAKQFFGDVGETIKMNEANLLAGKARDQATADKYLADSVTAYQEGNYTLARSLSNEASTIYANLKDVSKIAAAKRVYISSDLKPNAESNISFALKLKNEKDYVNASQHARIAFSLYTELNDTEGIEKSEAESILLEKYVEAEDYYVKAEQYYTAEELSEASTYLGKAKAIYTELGYGDGVLKVEKIEKKIGDTGTVENVALVGGIGLLILFFVGIILAALILFLGLSKKKKKAQRLADLNTDYTINKPSR